MAVTADVPKRFSSLIVELPVQQTGSGDPSPDNIRPIAQWTDVELYVADSDTATEPTVTTILPTPIFGGMVDVARGEVASLYNEKKSSSGWEMVEAGQFRCQVGAFNNGDETSTNVADLYSSHYKTVSNKDAYDATDDLTCGTPTIEGVTYLYVNDLDYSTLEDFTAYIGDVQFVYKSHIPMSDEIAPTIVYLPEGTSYVWADAGWGSETLSLTAFAAPTQKVVTKKSKVTSCEVSFTPSQDLHGYDAPWPAGGGKNKYNFATIEAGYIDAYGNIQDASSTMFCHSDYIPVTGEPMMWSGHSAIGNTKRLHCYTADKTWISNAYTVAINSGNTPYSMGGEMPEGTAYIRLSFAFTDTDVQLEYGNTVTAWSPYSNHCPISGWQGAEVTVSGKNLLKGTAYQYSSTQVRLGGESVDEWYQLLKAGTYTISWKYTGTGSPTAYYRDKNTGTNTTIGSNGTSFTLTEDKEIGIYAYKSGSLDMDDLEQWQLEIGSPASSYVPYRAPSTSSVTFGVQGKNLFNKNDSGIETKKAISNTSGNTYQANSWSVSGYIPVQPDEYYIISSDGSDGLDIVFFDENKTYITGYSDGRSAKQAPANARYVRFDYKTANIDNTMLEQGSSATSYEPYRDYILGGTGDVVQGTGSEEWVYVNANDVSWSNTGDEGIYTTFSDKKMSTQTAISDTFNARTYSTSNRVGWTESTPTRAEKLAIIANGNVHIAYKLSTPTPYTFPPASEQLTLAKGTNNAWAEMTNTETT